MVQWLGLHVPNVRRGPGSISGQETTRSHMLQLKIPPTATKTQSRQIQNKTINIIKDGAQDDHTAPQLTCDDIRLTQGVMMMT